MHTLSFSFRRRILTAALSVTIAVSFMLPPFSRGSVARAEEGQGTIIVDQGKTPYVGSFGLSMPTGVLDGESRIFTTQKPAGQYALTVTPPAGAVVHIDVYNDDTLTKSFNERTATARLDAGQTLKFSISYAFTRVGHLSVTTNPPGIRANLRGPRGMQRITTPFSDEHMPEGTYSVTYLLPALCKSPPSAARRLVAKGRVFFSQDIACRIAQGGKRSTRSSRRSSPLQRTRV